MKATNQKKMERLWGNQFDPEVTAETYLEHSDPKVVAWAKMQEQALQQLDRDTVNLHRRQAENCDFRGLDAKAPTKRQAKALPPQRGLPKDPTESWLNRIFSKSPEDLYQLMSDPVLAQAIKELTPHQQNVVHMSIVKKMKNSEIAKRLGTTDRNVRDVLQRTYEKMRNVLLDNRAEGSIVAVTAVLFIIVFPTFAIGWSISCWIYPKLKKAVMEQAA